MLYYSKHTKPFKEVTPILKFDYHSDKWYSLKEIAGIVGIPDNSYHQTQIEKAMFDFKFQKKVFKNVTNVGPKHFDWVMESGWEDCVKVTSEGRLFNTKLLKLLVPKVRRRFRIKVRSENPKGKEFYV